MATQITGQTEVLASETTRSNFSKIIDRIPEWIGHRTEIQHRLGEEIVISGPVIEKLLLLSPEDLAPDDGTDNSPQTTTMTETEMRGDFNSQGFVGPKKKGEEQEEKEPPKTPEEILRELLKQFPEFEQALSDEQIEFLAENITKVQKGYGGPFHFLLERDIQYKQAPIAILVTPRADTTKLDFAKMLAGGAAPKKSIENLPGTDEEWHMAVMMHEVGHSDRVGFNGLSWETDADEDISLSYEFELERGTVSTPDVPLAMQRLRALGAFYGASSPTHNTSAAIQTGSEGPAPAGSFHDFKEGLQNAGTHVLKIVGGEALSSNSLVYLPILKSIADDETRFDLSYPFLEDDEPLKKGEKDPSWVNEDDKEALREIIGNPGNTKEQIAQNLSPEGQETLQKAFDRVNMFYGYVILSENPELAYEKTRQAYLDGDFDDNPIGKQYVWEFLEAAKAHAPTHFGVPDTNEIFIQPVFNEAGEYIPPEPAPELTTNTSASETPKAKGEPTSKPTDEKKSPETQPGKEAGEGPQEKVAPRPPLGWKPGM